MLALLVRSCTTVPAEPGFIQEFHMNKIVAFLPLAIGAAAANAQAVDATTVAAAVTAQAAPVALVGGAVLVLYAGIKAFKWVRQAMS